jgi:hypothetical protein
VLLYALTIFLSAFLLFQVQPLIAKTILAWFGGSAAVWTTCMLFFQMALLAGYFYSHVVIGRLAPRAQAALHTGLLGMAVLLLPIIPSTRWKPGGAENPTLAILVLLAATVGLPYLLCSTTGPLLQAWYARRERGAAPYRLFALSNLGSMLALLSYPFLVEPYLPARLQAWTWSAGFVTFAILCAATAWRSASSAPLETATSRDEDNADPSPGIRQQLLWILLAACPSLLMLAVTNHVTQDVAAVPFLWVVPMSLYLLSFILTFDSRGWYRRNVFLVLLAPALGVMAYLQWSEAPAIHRMCDKLWPRSLQAACSGITGSWEALPDVARVVLLFFVCLFVACMVCHGELAARKPEPRHLTKFYLMLSIGGALGGLFVGLVAPYWFPAYWELPVGIALCAVLAWLVAVDEPDVAWDRSVLSVPSICLALGVIGLCFFLGRTMRDATAGYLLVQRNFYGTLRVRESDPGTWEGYRTLLHGSINHGEQWTHPERRRELLTYYCPESGIGRTMRSLPVSTPHKVGVLGLGAGTMAAFSRPGDEFRFYEINPRVPELARRIFSFVPDSAAKTEVVMGDGRLSLEREQRQQFDVLMMDAFSGDSIPVHLLTEQAFRVYFGHIKPDGIIVIHISNKYLDLEPVLARVAEKLGRPALLLESEEDESGNCFGTTFVLFANDESVLRRPALNGGEKPKIRASVPLWTDDYSNLFRILK